MTRTQYLTHTDSEALSPTARMWSLTPVKHCKCLFLFTFHLKSKQKQTFKQQLKTKKKLNI